MLSHSLLLGELGDSDRLDRVTPVNCRRKSAVVLVRLMVVVGGLIFECFEGKG
jgi:hypothetical protein